MLRLAKGIAIATIFSTLAVVPAEAGETWALGFDSYGPVSVGMSPHEAASALGTALVLTGVTPDRECYFVEPENGPEGLTLLVADGRVQRIDVHSSAMETGDGAHVGQTEESVRKLLGERLDSPDAAAGPAGAPALAATPPTGARSPYRMVFWQDGGHVSRISSGEASWAISAKACR